MSSKAYHRAYYLKHKDKYKAYARKAALLNPERVAAASAASKKKNFDFKRSLLHQFSCVTCGEADQDMIDWHHVTPSDKLFNVTDYTKSFEKWWDEVLKCIPVCVSCHRKIHKNKLCLIPPKL